MNTSTRVIFSRCNFITKGINVHLSWLYRYVLMTLQYLSISATVTEIVKFTQIAILSALYSIIILQFLYLCIWALFALLNLRSYHIWIYKENPYQVYNVDKAFKINIIFSSEKSDSRASLFCSARGKDNLPVCMPICNGVFFEKMSEIFKHINLKVMKTLRWLSL